MALDKAAAFPVVIIGGGPIGLAASLLLSREGVRCIVVERRDTPSCGAAHPLKHPGSAAYLVRPDCYLAAVEVIEAGSTDESWTNRIRAAWHRAMAREPETEVSL